MPKNLAVKIFLFLICTLLAAGCGENNNNAASQNDAQKPFEINFQVLQSPGYYGDIRMQPNGVFLVRNKISEEQAQNYGVVYKVDFNEENKLNKITAMQGGIPIAVDWQDTLNRKFKFSAITIEYTNNQIRYNFRSSRMAAIPGFYNAYTIGYKVDENKKNTPVAYLYDKEGNQLGAWNGYAQMFFTYDEKDNLVKIVFADDSGSRVTNHNNEYELRLTYGKKFGFPSEIANYGKDGSLKVDKSGIAKTTFKFDDKNRVIEVRHFGSDESLKDKNNPNLVFDKVINSISAGAITRYSYNDNTDRVSKISFLGKDEQAEGIKAWGNIASVELKYTPEGWISSVASFATDDSPIALAKNYFGDNVVKVEMENDEYGNLSRMVFYSKDDNVVVASKLGAAECRYKHDEKRRETGKEYFGTGDEKIEINDQGFNYHGVTYEYNDDDEITLMIFYDKNANEVQRRNIAPKNENVSQISPAAENTNQNTRAVAAAAASSESAQSALQRYYNLIASGSQREAYNMLSNDMQTYYKSYSNFVDATGGIALNSVRDIQVVQSNSNVSTLSYKFLTMDNKTFAATVTLENSGGKWIITDLRVRSA